jgi:hypothetical protein
MLNFDFPEFDPDRSVVPLALIWPRPGNPGPVYLSFSKLADWRRFIEEFNLDPLVPQMMWDKYPRAQKLYYLGWIDGDCIKAGGVRGDHLELLARSPFCCTSRA